MKLETLALHTYAHPDAHGAIAPGLSLSTTFEHPADSVLTTGYLYQRYSDPNAANLEATLCALEGGKAALCFSTGMAAASALMQSLPPGSHVLLADDCYFAVRRLFATEGARMGISHRLLDLCDEHAVQSALEENVTAIWAETPSNPLMKVCDLEMLATRAKARGAQLLVDATFATPVLQRSLELGADVVMHSSTKYFGGHSDVMGGALIFKQQEQLHARCAELRKLHGSSSAPFNSWLIARGLKTLACRVRTQSATALRLALWLEARSEVERVLYPGLSSHPQHQVAVRQMQSGGAMLSILVRGSRARTLAIADGLKIIKNATSLGAVETLIEHRRSVEGITSSTPEQLLRISVGLEHVDDLIADLTQAFERADCA
jgi:cystathionine gamma-synthase